MTQSLIFISLFPANKAIRKTNGNGNKLITTFFSPFVEYCPLNEKIFQWRFAITKVTISHIILGCFLPEKKIFHKIFAIVPTPLVLFFAQILIFIPCQRLWAAGKKTRVRKKVVHYSVNWRVKNRMKGKGG